MSVTIPKDTSDEENLQLEWRLHGHLFLRYIFSSQDGWLSLVEGTGFENRRWGNLSGGSNPSPSAYLLTKVSYVNEIAASLSLFAPAFGHPC